MGWLLAGTVVIILLIVLVVAYLGLVTAAVPIDLGFGRRVRPLGPQTVVIAAPRELVFDVIAAPYLDRQTRAVAEKIRILDRGTDMVLAAHRTPIHKLLGVRGRLVATTVETVGSAVRTGWTSGWCAAPSRTSWSGSPWSTTTVGRG